MQENIKHLTGYDYDYSVSIDGKVFKDGIELHPSDNGVGYLSIKLLKNHRRVHKYVHRLVWEAFQGEICRGYEVNHIDHNKKNNALENLEVLTHSENLKKAFIKHGYFGSMNRPKE